MREYNTTHPNLNVTKVRPVEAGVQPAPFKFGQITQIQVKQGSREIGFVANASRLARDACLIELFAGLHWALVAGLTKTGEIVDWWAHALLFLSEAGMVASAWLIGVSELWVLARECYHHARPEFRVEGTQNVSPKSAG